MMKSQTRTSMQITRVSVSTRLATAVFTILPGGCLPTCRFDDDVIELVLLRFHQVRDHADEVAPNSAAHAAIVQQDDLLRTALLGGDQRAVDVNLSILHRQQPDILQKDGFELWRLWQYFKKMTALQTRKLDTDSKGRYLSTVVRFQYNHCQIRGSLTF